MAKKLTKSINSRFNPTYVGNFPIYGCGGKMKACGGKIPYGFGSWLQNNAGTIGTIAGAGIGSLIAPGIGTSLGASIGGQLGGGIQSNHQQDQQLAQQQQQALTQSLVSNLPASKDYTPTFAKGGIYIKPSKRGTFTAAATKHGKGVQEFASQVLANKGNYSPAMVKKANFARNAAKWHADGGPLDAQDKLAQYYKSQGQKGAKAARKGMNKFAKDYALPATAMVAGTLMAPGIGGYAGRILGGRGLGTAFNLTDDVAVNATLDAFGEAGKALPYTSLYGYMNAKKGTLNKTPKIFRNDPVLQPINDRAMGQNMQTNMLPEVQVKGNYYPPYNEYQPSENQEFIQSFLQREAQKLGSKAYGGNLDNTTSYKNGGTHQQNPYGGIPIGDNALVEEGEVRFDLDGGESYIFSNRIPYKRKK